MKTKTPAKTSHIHALLMKANGNVTNIVIRGKSLKSLQADVLSHIGCSDLFLANEYILIGGNAVKIVLYCDANNNSLEAENSARINMRASLLRLLCMYFKTTFPDPEKQLPKAIRGDVLIYCSDFLDCWRGLAHLEYCRRLTRGTFGGIVGGITD
jgi:hypothetical protein